MQQQIENENMNLENNKEEIHDTRVVLSFGDSSPENLKKSKKKQKKLKKMIKKRKNAAMS